MKKETKKVDVKFDLCDTYLILFNKGMEGKLAFTYWPSLEAYKNREQILEAKVEFSENYGEQIDNTMKFFGRYLQLGYTIENLQ